jgi:hypothetical protein
MASNVVSDNFETGTGGVPQLGGTGATTCKAWVNFDGTTNVIRDSYNVSSITDYGTGYHGINFTTPMSNGEYSVSGSAQRPGDDNNAGMCVHYGAAPSTTSVRISSRYPSTGNSKEYERTYVQIFSN